MSLYLIILFLILGVVLISYASKKATPQRKSRVTRSKQTAHKQQPQQGVSNGVVDRNYILDDGHPSVLDTFIPDSKLFKRDMTGLRQYFNEMPNMERIFNEFTYSIRNGYSIETYLSKANLMNDSEIRQIAGKGFSTIAGFLSDMLNIQENEELRKDLEACKEAQKILLNLKED